MTTAETKTEKKIQTIKLDEKELAKITRDLHAIYAHDEPLVLYMTAKDAEARNGIWHIGQGQTFSKGVLDIWSFQQWKTLSDIAISSGRVRAVTTHTSCPFLGTVQNYQYYLNHDVKAGELVDVFVSDAKTSQWITGKVLAKRDVLGAPEFDIEVNGQVMTRSMESWSIMPPETMCKPLIFDPMTS